MAVALEQFVKQLTDSGVIAPGKLENFIPPKAAPKDAQELARQLVQSKHLTKFQAQEIYAGRARSLILGNYTILDKIGAGGMGQVFKAEHRRMHRLVAIKMLPAAMTRDPITVARFQREVEAAAKLSHPNIVAAYDADEAGGVHFLAMEYIEGTDLSALVKKNGPFSVAKAVNYILQAARGLEYAHSEHVVHRDIKPSNLLLDKKGTVKILDMGLARIETAGDAATQSELTGTGAVMGTVDYMAPEQALSTRHAGARADIYSLGCTLYYLVAGKAIFGGDTLMAKLMAHSNQPAPSLRDIQPDVSEELDAVFHRMVAKKPEDRYSTMSEVVAALEALDQHSPSQPPSISFPQSVTTNPDADAQTFPRGIPVQPVQQPKATEKPPAPKPPAKKGGENNKRLILMSATGMLAATLLAGVLISLKSKDGTLIVNINQPDASVQVLNEEGKVEISQPGANGKLSIAVDPGKHRLKVEKNGFQFFTQDFVLESNGEITIQARLEPVGSKPAIAGAEQGNKPWNSPAFEEWMKGVAPLPAERQVDAVAKKLQSLNPDFDGTEHHKIEGGVVVELEFHGENVADISPVRALPGLQRLICTCWGPPYKLSDLSPLQGMRLTLLDCNLSQVSDLSPLKGMPLNVLECSVSLVSDLSPLRGMPLARLNISRTQVHDLSSLQGMQLARLWCGETKIVDLTPLAGMHLDHLLCPDTQISDLSPLKGMPLSMLNVDNTKVFDFSPLQGSPLATLTCNGTPLPDLSSLKGMQLEGVSFKDTRVSDLTPLHGMQLRYVDCGGTQVRDLAPLRGMKLSRLRCGPSVSDLSALKGMPLTFLAIVGTQVSDLAPLAEMPLTTFYCENSQVTDLSPLQGMSLQEVTLTPGRIIKGIDVLRHMNSITTIGLAEDKDKFPPAEFWKRYDAGEFSKPDSTAVAPDHKPIATLNDPTFQRWIKTVAALPADKQVDAVAKKLQELNPGFDGKENHKIEGGVVTELSFVTDNVTDISPVHALAGLASLVCGGSDLGKGKLLDLSPLKGMRLTFLGCWNTQVSDLSPLRQLKLTTLALGNTQVSDLSPLNGMPLTSLSCVSTNIIDLSPLRGMALTGLDCSYTHVSDLSPLTGMPLEGINCDGSRVADLSPLKNMNLLTRLYCKETSVSDLTPLDGLKLTTLTFTPKNITKGIDAIRRMKSLGTLWADRRQFSSDEFWKKYDAGEFNK